MDCNKFLNIEVINYNFHVPTGHENCLYGLILFADTNHYNRLFPKKIQFELIFIKAAIFVCSKHASG